MTNEELDALRDDILNLKFKGCRSCMSLQRRVEELEKGVNLAMDKLEDDTIAYFDSVQQAWVILDGIRTIKKGGAE